MASLLSGLGCQLDARLKKWEVFSEQAVSGLGLLSCMPGGPQEEE